MKNSNKVAKRHQFLVAHSVAVSSARDRTAPRALTKKKPAGPFFSSGVADNALRLGPYMRRSRLK